jgi:hypothetical protein
MTCLECQQKCRHYIRLVKIHILISHNKYQEVYDVCKEGIAELINNSDVHIGISGYFTNYVVKAMLVLEKLAPSSHRHNADFMF